MQTLVLYLGKTESLRVGAASGVGRVESHFAPLWPSGWARHGWDLPFGGLHLWDVDDADCRWPSWSEDEDTATATLYVPLGYQRLIGDVPPERAPQLLGRSLMHSPEGVFELTPPTVVARLDKKAPRLDLWTDALGVGRMFQLRAPEVWVWSNRPEAACLFAGVSARPDPMGWRYHAAVDWFMGETSPIEGVTAVPAASHVTVSARGAAPVISRLDASLVYSGSWPVDLEGVAEALRDAARSITAIWPRTPTLDLTGGRDSRVVVAAFLSAGIDVQLHTHDAVPGEAEAAEHLVGLLDRPVPHDVVQLSSSTRRGASPIVVGERVRRWHRYGSGLRPASYLAHGPAKHGSLSPPVIGGAGGEISHGFYYPAGILTVEELPLIERVPVYRDHLLRRLLGLMGSTDAARAESAAQIDRVLRQGLSLGLSDAGLLDYFYADERLRRWGTTAERRGLVSPLLTPAFVRAGFALSPRQRLDTVLHRGVLEHLVPSWADVPFFKPTRTPPPTVPRVAPPAEPFRLGSAVDADQLEPVFALPSRWSADMDHQVVRELWAASRAGTSAKPEELALWRVVWRDLFNDYLAETLGGTPEPRGLRRRPRPLQRVRDRRRVCSGGRRGPVRAGRCVAADAVAH